LFDEKNEDRKSCDTVPYVVIIERLKFKIRKNLSFQKS
jgi:hypothetical protein